MAADTDVFACCMIHQAINEMSPRRDLGGYFAASIVSVAGKQRSGKLLALCFFLIPSIRRSFRSEKDQDVLLGTQDKVLVGLRALSSSLTPDLHRHFQTALLALVAQSGFTKKVTSVRRTCCRDHAPCSQSRPRTLGRVTLT